MFAGIIYRLNEKEGYSLAVGAAAVVLALVGKFSYLGIISVLIGFFMHEMAHRFFARRAMCSSRFVLDPLGLAITLISSILPLAFLAPGYVGIYCYGNVLRRGDMLKISSGGIATNLALSIIGAILYPISPAFFSTFSVINAWFALFNLIPFGPFDGAKIFKISKLIWIIMFILSLSLYLYWII
ncbi:MAG: hypothetical protein QW039_05210 [Fervidicoccaceae archaeon]